jgi:hypothetical protein
MARYFTLDRAKTLKAGQRIDLVRYGDVTPPELQTHVNSLFPQGVTSHGERYLLRAETPANGVNSVIELLFEYVRRSQFPKCPSRFQSIFACKTIEEAEAFKNQHGTPDSLIWEVEASKGFRVDMKFLTLQGSLLILSYNAARYWEGLPSDANPFWEFLLTPPVKVVRQR